MSYPPIPVCPTNKDRFHTPEALSLKQKPSSEGHYPIIYDCQCFIARIELFQPALTRGESATRYTNMTLSVNDTYETLHTTLRRIFRVPPTNVMTSHTALVNNCLCDQTLWRADPAPILGSMYDVSGRYKGSVCIRLHTPAPTGRPVSLHQDLSRSYHSVNSKQYRP